MQGNGDADHPVTGDGDGPVSADGDGDGDGTGDGDGPVGQGDHPAPDIEQSGPVSAGGTMTFQNIGAKGYWGRRIEATQDEPSCDVESRLIDFGWGTEYCCRTKHEVTSDKLTPFNEQMTLILRGPMHVKQLAVYQGTADESFVLRSFWDARSDVPSANFKFTGPDNDPKFTGVLGNACHWYAMQEKPYTCGPGSDPYCPTGGPDVDYEGWDGSKLVALLASMPYADDPAIQGIDCATGDNAGWTDAPWLGFSASELMRDGWGKYHPCHCYANTNAGVGDGCGEINVFEVVSEKEGTQYGNRDIISTGLRSYQFGSLGGSVCGADSCKASDFSAEADLVDACKKQSIAGGAVMVAEQGGGGCPVWQRPKDDRYFLALLDEKTRTVQIVIVHPKNIPSELSAVLPGLSNKLPRSVIDSLTNLRLPAAP
jgi:hypothetical protein